MLLRRVILHFRNQKWTAIALTVGSGVGSGRTCI